MSPSTVMAKQPSPQPTLATVPLVAEVSSLPKLAASKKKPEVAKAETSERSQPRQRRKRRKRNPRWQRLAYQSRLRRLRRRHPWCRPSRLPRLRPKSRRVAALSAKPKLNPRRWQRNHHHHRCRRCHPKLCRMLRRRRLRNRNLTRPSRLRLPLITVQTSISGVCSIIEVIRCPRTYAKPPSGSVLRPKRARWRQIQSGDHGVFRPGHVQRLCESG